MPIRTSLRLILVTFAISATLVGRAAAVGPYILVDVETGKVVAQHDAGHPSYPASVTKLMTTYLTFHAMREGKLQPDTLLTVSANALAQPPSKMGFKVGTQVTVDNALKMLMVKSANDIAVVLAEGVSGSVSDFVQEMNRAARGLGMSGTLFANPNGLPDETQVTTARDMALLARAIIREFPEHEMLFRLPGIRLGRRVMRNHNKLIDRYPGADGMKTGFICASGFNVVATATRNNKKLIAVLFGAQSSMQRSADVARLFERGFSGPLALASLFSANRPTVDSITNAALSPVDLRDKMCGRHRKRPASESDIEEELEAAEPSGANGSARPSNKQSLLIDMPPSMQPVRVYVGPPPGPSDPAVTVAQKSAKRARAAKPKRTGQAVAAETDAKAGDKAKSTKSKPKSESVGDAGTKAPDKPKSVKSKPKAEQKAAAAPKGESR